MAVSKAPAPKVLVNLNVTRTKPDGEVVKGRYVVVPAHQVKQAMLQEPPRMANDDAPNAGEQVGGFRLATDAEVAEYLAETKEHEAQYRKRHAEDAARRDPQTVAVAEAILRQAQTNADAKAASRKGKGKGNPEADADKDAE
jgi:hypothetical protein